MDALLSVCKGKSVAIVGNGPSILDNKNGSFIDSHDIVVRFNNFSTIGYEEYTGKRTDIWVSSFWEREVIAHPCLDSFSLVICPFPAYNGKPSFSQINRELAESCGSSYIPREIYNGVESIVSSASSGCVFLFWLYKLFGKIPKESLFGFSFFDPTKSHHYFEDTPRVDSDHKGEEEKNFIRSILQ